MSRPKEFDIDSAVEAAVEVFRTHGFEGTSAQMLVDAMGIGRQSLYDTFGDKWGLYLTAVRHYSQKEVGAHCEVLASREKAIDGIRAMFDRVVDDAGRGCLGLSSTVEFGCARPDLVKIRDASAGALARALRGALVEARRQGDVAAELGLDDLATFLITTIASIRLAARSGAGKAQISAMVDLALRALR